MKIESKCQNFLSQDFRCTRRELLKGIGLGGLIAAEIGVIGYDLTKIRNSLELNQGVLYTPVSVESLLLNPEAYNNQNVVTTGLAILDGSGKMLDSKGLFIKYQSYRVYPLGQEGPTPSEEPETAGSGNQDFVRVKASYLIDTSDPRMDLSTKQEIWTFERELVEIWGSLSRSDTGEYLLSVNTMAEKTNSINPFNPKVA